MCQALSVRSLQYELLVVRLHCANSCNAYCTVNALLIPSEWLLLRQGIHLAAAVFPVFLAVIQQGLYEYF